MAASLGLRTSGRQLREMLRKSGARHNTDGAEKLDFLVWVADQVKGSIEEKRRMHLTAAELSDFLRVEQLENFQLDAKGAVKGLLALRRRELARLCYDSDRARNAEATDACFEVALLEMPMQEVADCFGTPCEELVVVARSDAKKLAGPTAPEPVHSDLKTTKNSKALNPTQYFVIGRDSIDDDAEEEFFSSALIFPSGCKSVDDTHGDFASAPMRCTVPH